MLPTAFAGRFVAAIQKAIYIVNFEECYGSLWLSVRVKNLPLVMFCLWPVRAAAAICPVVGNDHELEHVVV